MSTIDEQLLLHDAAGYCDYLRLRPATLPGEGPPPILGEEMDRDLIVAALAPALELAWQDFPAEPEAIGPFLEEAVERFEAKAAAMSGSEDFVPAAEVMTAGSRDLTFEHLKQELGDVLGGIDTEDFWRSFDSLDVIAPIKHLALAGLLIKMRSLGSFLIGRANKFEDEIAAVEFFPTGRWKQVRDASLCDQVLAYDRMVNKSFAHLTLSRPLPEERDIYEPASYRPELEILVQLFETFTENVDHRLLPDWWREWLTGFAEQARWSPSG
jgi:hypothetical protein